MTDINETVKNIRDFYYTNATKDVDFRIEQLKRLRNAVKKYEPQIFRALHDDLRKNEFEVITTENFFAYDEIDYALKHIKKWVKPDRAKAPFYTFPSKAFVMKEPYGVSLIIDPFNYPIMLSMAPLIGAIAAGCCTVLRPSAKTPATSKAMYDMIEEFFPSNYIKCFLPEQISHDELLKGEYDYIFFTGSTKTGITVAKAAAERLIPCTLELGGKSPAIVDKTANIEVSAKRIIWGKCTNAGQTCVAPDFVYVDKEIKQQLVEEMIKAIKEFYGPITQESPDYGRIIDDKAFDRLQKIISDEARNLIYGGETDKCGLYIEPTLLDVQSFDNPSMQNELFGPILPILTFDSIDEAIINLRQHPKPLALYVFTKNKKLWEKVVENVSFGGGAINDTMNQMVHPTMPFGGVGYSGYGQYHGKYSFDTFSRPKSILVRNADFGFKEQFPPYSDEIIRLAHKVFG